MNIKRKIILGAALICLALLFIFPARRYPEGMFDSGSGAAPRIFLFSREIYFGYAAQGVTSNASGFNQQQGFWARLDPTRTALEALSIIAVAGILLVLTARNERA